MERPRGRLLLRITAGFIILVTLAIAISGVLALQSSASALDAEHTRHALSVARLAASKLNPQYLAYLGDRLDDKALDQYHIFGLVRNQLREAQLATGVRGLTVIDPRTRRVLLDLSEDALPIGAEYPYALLDQSQLDSILEGEAATSILYRDPEANYYKTAYAPIRDPSRAGGVVAAVVVEMGASYEPMLSLLQRRFIWIGALAALLSVILSFLIARSIVHPLRNLVGAMEETSEAGVPAKVDVSGKGEIAYLGGIFNRMVEDLQDKDQALRDALSRAKMRAQTVESYQNSLLEGMASGVIGVDTAGTIVVFNSAAARILEEPVPPPGATYEEFLGPRHPLSQVLSKCLEEQSRTDRLEVPLPATDGEERWLGIASAPVVDPEDHPIGAAVIFTDLTELRVLRQQVATRERLSALGELSAGLAHEIRNPLGAIKGYVGLLHRQLDDEENQELAELIEEEIDVLNRLVTDVLEYSGQLVLQDEETELEPLMRRAAEIGTATAPPSIEVELDLSEGLEAKIDAVRVRKMVINLVQNAVRAMPEGGRLTLRTKRSEDGESCIIEVSDTGIGMSKELQNKIFNPFYTTHPDGTGLGLAISHRVVQAHHGSIRCQSTPDEGTTFTIHLPLNGK